MPLQNRVEPSGSIHAVAARGLFTGNRGVIHDPETRGLTGRRWTTKAWIICRCDFKGRKRDVFGRNGRGGGTGWTNLFFLDEVTALAAGHRPCFECRRSEAVAFGEAFARGNALRAVKAKEMDDCLHLQRLSAHGVVKPMHADAIAALPDCAVIKTDECFLAKKSGTFREWSFSGYRTTTQTPDTALLITPLATVAALIAGYRPIWHSSA